MTAKDDRNLQQVLDRIAEMDEPQRSVMRRAHDVIVATAPDLKPRIWYGMPAYALSAGTPALLSLRNDERMNLGLTEKAAFRPAGGADGQLMPAAWYFEEIDEATEKRIAEIVREALA